MRSSNDYGTFNEHWGKLLKERSNIDPHGGAYEGLKPATRPVGKRSVYEGILNSHGTLGQCSRNGLAIFWQPSEAIPKTLQVTHLMRRPRGDEDGLALVLSKVVALHTFGNKRGMFRNYHGTVATRRRNLAEVSVHIEHVCDKRQRAGEL